MVNSDDEIDSQFILENVEFLDPGSSSSFDISANYRSLKIVTKLYTEEETRQTKYGGRSKQRKGTTSQNKSSALDTSVCSSSQITNTTANGVKNKKLRAWGLPEPILQKYESRGIKEMFEWQVSCLGNSKVLIDGCNLVYSAPTSAGKTLVAEILAIKTLLERHKKVIIILPFVSIVREKTLYMQDILSSSGIRVEGFMGSQSPPGGLQAVHVAICTIEKANSLVNKLLDEGSISDLGAVIVDEMHLLGDPHRGYILELLLTKVKYVSTKSENVHIQIVGMSATLPNLEVLAQWLDAELFITSFRPIPLDEYCLIGKQYYNGEGICVGEMDDTDFLGLIPDSDSVLRICFDTIKEGCSTLIFCMTKNRCESLAQNVAASFYKLGCSGNTLGKVLREQLNTDAILEVLEQLKGCPVGLDNILKNTVSFGVAYHHAGLTFDERDIIESSFKSGAIRVLVATSTLSSGVNLPARKVIVRTPVFLRQPINILTYKQMIGRAGRMGKDSKGESILICTQSEKNIGMNLMMGALEPVKSCIEDDDKFLRIVLEIVASGVACTDQELDLYSKCTLLFNQKDISKTLLEKTLVKLIEYELIRSQNSGIQRSFVATSLGKACLSSSMAPNDGLSLFFELQKARECIVLETDLHLLYLVTPYSVSNQWADIGWLHLLTMYHNMSRAMKRVADLIGVKESYIIRRMNNAKNSTTDQDVIHKRFYTTLALQDLVNEVPLVEVATKFECARGFLQSLQQAAATFAGMVTVFCHQLGWKNLEMLVAQFQDRLHFGIHSELIELMKLPSLNGVRARSLFNAGYETIPMLAAGDCNGLEDALVKALPFQSEKPRDCDDDVEVRKRNKMKNVWITGHCGMTTRQAAENLILEARRYVQLELGVKDIKWDKTDETNHNQNQELGEEIEMECDVNMNKEPADVATEPHPYNLNIKNDKNKEDFSNEDYQFRLNDCSNNTSLVENCTIPTNNIDTDTKIKDECVLNGEIEFCSELSRATIVEHFASPKPKLDLCVSIIKEEKDERQNKSPGYSAESNTIVWDSLNFTEGALTNITKNRISNSILSPQISFNDSDIKIDDGEKSTPKSTNMEISKDVSLFSGDEAERSLFEDSLPMDEIPTKILDDVSIKSETSKTYAVEQIFTLNEDSIMNAFHSEIVIEDDEDIKLVYDEDDNKCNERVPEKAQEKPQFVKQSLVFSVPIDRLASEIDNISPDQPRSKKRKLKSPKIINPDKVKSRKFETLNTTASWYEMEENDIVLLDHIDAIAMICVDHKPHGNKKVIGSNICSSKTELTNETDEPFSIYFYCGFGSVLVLDATQENLINFKMYDILRLWLAKTHTCLRVESSGDIYLALRKLGLDVAKCFDITLAKWLIDSATLEETWYKLLRTQHNVAKCVAIWLIAEKQQQYLITKPDTRTTLVMENQVALILAQSEHDGVTVDKKLASNMLNIVKKCQSDIESKLYQIRGYRINLRDSKDVAKLLGIDKPRGRSTKKSALMGLGPTADMVVLWRKLDCVLTKTLFPLVKNCSLSAGDKIHPKYTMFTATGRMSMFAPNLQSVPRPFPLEISRQNNNGAPVAIDICNCRDIFVAAPGCVLVSADYCQLEMRILTHYCGDSKLTAIMRSPDVDVFKSIAASWCNIAEEDVDSDLRHRAKQLCYGIIYGMGTKTLSVSLDITEADANCFMHSFHKTYPAIALFQKQVISNCLKTGYVETLLKRRRYLPDIHKSTGRAQAERQAVNTTIQGSAADVAKSAMCAIDNDLRLIPVHRRARLMLQMHDELIYEVPESSRATFVVLLKRAMENTVSLNVPLPVKVKSGLTWGNLINITETEMENFETEES